MSVNILLHPNYAMHFTRVAILTLVQSTTHSIIQFTTHKNTVLLDSCALEYLTSINLI